MQFDYLHRDSSATGVGTVFDFATPFRANSRVVDGHIGYKNGMEPTLHALFAARAEMHQKVYTHRERPVRARRGGGAPDARSPERCSGAAVGLRRVAAGLVP